MAARLSRHPRANVAAHSSADCLATPGEGGWTFAPIPARLAPPVTRPWGRTPVRAVVDGVAWDTSIWRDKRGASLLAVPARIRGAKGHGDSVTVEFSFEPD